MAFCTIKDEAGAVYWFASLSYWLIIISLLALGTSQIVFTRIAIINANSSSRLVVLEVARFRNTICKTSFNCNIAGSWVTAQARIRLSRITFFASWILAKTTNFLRHKGQNVIAIERASTIAFGDIWKIIMI
jgi:hypothetical protein